MRPSTNVFGTATLLILSSLASCLAPEEGIDRTRVLGVVRVDPAKVREGGDAKDNITVPNEAPALGYGWTHIDGKITDTSVDEAGLPTGDLDCFQLVTPIDRGVSTDEGAADAVSIDLLLGDATATARVTVYDTENLVGVDEDTNGNGDLNPGEDLDGDGVLDVAVPSVVAESDVTGGGSISAVLTAKVAYSLCVTGLAAPGEVSYDLLVSGQHPDEANVLVGLYSSDDPADRGSLLGGTDAQDFVPVDTYSFIARYEMLFVREFQTDTDGDVTVLDEDVKSGFVWAGDWSNLSQGLPAGTWYSSTPIPVDLTKTDGEEVWGVYDDELVQDTAVSTDTAVDDPLDGLPPRYPAYPTVNVAEPVLVDTIAPIVIGFEIAEVEPNDMPSLDPLLEGDLAQDLGVLSGPGFVDVVSGEIQHVYGDYYYYGSYWGYYPTDEEGFKFQVPVTSELAFTLEWPDGATDLDVVVFDDAGVQIDQGYFAYPEINENPPLILEAGRDYWIMVLLWSTPEAGNIPWTLKLEQIAQ